jgi:hypothetical protein
MLFQFSHSGLSGPGEPPAENLSLQEEEWRPDE